MVQLERRILLGSCGMHDFSGPSVIKDLTVQQSRTCSGNSIPAAINYAFRGVNHPFNLPEAAYWASDGHFHFDSALSRNLCFFSCLVWSGIVRDPLWRSTTTKAGLSFTVLWSIQLRLLKLVHFLSCNSLVHPVIFSWTAPPRAQSLLRSLENHHQSWSVELRPQKLIFKSSSISDYIGALQTK